jgi:hypothetical protein
MTMMTEKQNKNFFRKKTQQKISHIPTFLSFFLFPCNRDTAKRIVKVFKSLEI